MLSYLYFSHVSFALSDGERLVVIDPFFSGEFIWNNKTETHLDRPTIDPTTVRPIDAILVSHEHGDHWDPFSLRALSQGVTPPPQVVAPRPTLDLMQQMGVDISRFTQAARGQQFQIGAMTITVFPAIESENSPEPVQRVGYLVEAHGACFYHQGDSHGPARAWQAFKDRLDAVVVWPVYVDHYCRQLQPRSVIFHHMDRFTPGDFFCNKNAQRELDYWSENYKDIRFVAPRRNIWLSVKTHAPV
jgi:L-ascorbate metabolism protein UlaG (beta-lactamase superfamily)